MANTHSPLQGTLSGKPPVSRLSLVIGGAVWTALLLWWITFQPADTLSERIPGMDGAPPDLSSARNTPDQVKIGAFFSLYEGAAAVMPGRWPQFRGPRRDNIALSAAPLMQSFSNTAPVLWTVKLGEGHAGPAVAGGRVFVLDYDEQKNADALRCFSMADGREIWRRWYEVKIKRNHGMSRTVPALGDSVAVTIGPRCHVMCTHALSGDFLWGMDLAAEYGTEVPMWYTGQCPLIDDTVAVIAPGGKALMIGVHCRTGKVLWETPNPRGWKMSHSSVMPMELNGRKIYLYCASGGLSGIAAGGAERGAVLFETEAFNQSVVAPSPVVLDKGRIFVTAGYSAGSMLFQVKTNGNVFTIGSLARFGVKEGPSSEQQTPLYHQGHLFMVLPKDAGTYRGQFVCVHPDNPTAIIWSSGKERRFGLGPYLIADDKFYILNDNGMLTVARFSTRRFEELARIRLWEAIDAWGPMALVAGRLLVRDAGRMAALDIRR